MFGELKLINKQTLLSMGMGIKGIKKLNHKTKIAYIMYVCTHMKALPRTENK